MLGTIKKIVGRVDNPSEVIATLTALGQLRPLFQGAGLYIESARCICFSKAADIIAGDPDKTVYSIAKDHITPRDLALLIVFQVASEELSFGSHHSYVCRGILSPIGDGFKSVFGTAVAESVKSGFITQIEAQQDVNKLDTYIKEMG
jgi:hypothetical protein